jgi:hypothetical protein
MQLKHRFLEVTDTANGNLLQVSYRRDAVQYAVAGIERHHDAVLDSLGRDPLSLAMEGTMKDWVIETLFQGAYMREYHLWEKDCKSYFPAMALRNNGLSLPAPKNRKVTEWVVEMLSLFGVSVPTDVSNRIDRMRLRVNEMKHEAGLELDHFITEAEYTDAVDALEAFWTYLASEELAGP